MNKTDRYTPSWSSLDTRPIPQWFENAKFGIFVHWGIYSVPAWRKLEPGRFASYAEWYYASVMYNEENGGREFHRKNFGENFEYRDFAPMFKAELFQPDQWGDLFKNSGAKYVVLTTKHHDGYSLWPTQSLHKKNWNSMDVGPGRDLVGELTRAVKSAGLKMGLYYSIIDWESCRTHRTATGYFLPKKLIEKYSLSESEYVDQVLNFQLREIVEKYKPSLIFSDGGEWDGSDEHWKTKEFLAWLYNDSPVKNEVVVNDRFCKDMPGNHGDYYSSEYNDTEGTVFNHPWEESRGVGESYGFNRAENINDYNTSKELIHELIHTVSRGGNLLLNVGPTADGLIPVIMQERLVDIGNWLRTNGEAIYHTRKPVMQRQSDSTRNVFFTETGNTLFCIFTKWLKTLEIELSGAENVESIKMLGYTGSIPWKITEPNKLTVEIPGLTVDEIPCLHGWTLKIELSQ